MEWWNGPSKEQGYMGAFIWIGGILAVVVGAALLYSHIIGQIAQAMK